MVDVARFRGPLVVTIASFLLYPLLLGKRCSKVQSKRLALVPFRCYAIVFTMLGGARVE
jgi:hypothetical protein